MSASTLEQEILRADRALCVAAFDAAKKIGVSQVSAIATLARKGFDAATIESALVVEDAGK